MTVTSTTINLAVALEALAADLAELGLGVAVETEGAIGSVAFGDAAQRQTATVASEVDDGLITSGTATARARPSFDDAASYGLLVAQVGPGEGAGRRDDALLGDAVVRGTAKAEGRGVSVGLQEFLDPDEIPGDEGDDGDGGEEDFGPGPEDFLPSFEAHVDLGGGADVVDGSALVAVDAGDEELIFAGSNGVIVDRDSVLDLGAGDDVIQAVGRLRASGGEVEDNDADGVSSPDADLEVIVDGLENVGRIDLGPGADRIDAAASVRSLSGATAIADGIDNSSVGNPNPVGGSGGGVALSAGGGDDAIHARGTSIAKGDGAIANGMDTRSLVDLGRGNDTLELTARATFIDTAEALGQQEEAIADGLENRGLVLLGNGDDEVVASATARGNGVLTIADGIDSRGDPGIAPATGGRGVSIDAGRGDDSISAHGRAIATAPVQESGAEPEKVAKTIASGLLTENSVAGLVTMGAGSDSIEARGTASGRATDTAAFGLSNVSFDIPNGEARSGVDLGRGADSLTAHAVAGGDGLVAAYGIWGGEVDTGGGADNVHASAVIRDAAQAEAIGINIDDDFELFGGTNAADEAIIGESGAGIELGGGADVLEGVARAQAGVDDAFVAGIFVGEAGTLAAGDGGDSVKGVGVSRGARGDIFAIAGEAGGRIDMGAGADVVDASRGGFGGGFELDLGRGADLVRGFGEVDVDGGRGADTLDLGLSLRDFVAAGGSARALRDGALALALEGQEMRVRDVETLLFGSDVVAADDLLVIFDGLIG